MLKELAGIMSTLLQTPMQLAESLKALTKGSTNMDTEASTEHLETEK